MKRIIKLIFLTLMLVIGLVACAADHVGTQSSSAACPTEQGYTIIVDSNEMLSINGKATKKADIVSQLKKMGATHSSPISIQANRKTDYKIIRAILDALASDNFYHVSFNAI